MPADLHPGLREDKATVVVAVQLDLVLGLTPAADRRASAEELVDQDHGLMLARATVVLDRGLTPEVVDSAEVPDHGKARVKARVALASLRAPDLGLAREKDRAVATEAVPALIHGPELGRPADLVALASPSEEEELALDRGTKPEDSVVARLAVAVAVVHRGPRMVASGPVAKELDGTFHKDRNSLVALTPGIKVVSVVGNLVAPVVVHRGRKDN